MSAVHRLYHGAATDCVQCRDLPRGGCGNYDLPVMASCDGCQLNRAIVAGLVVIVRRPRVNMHARTM